MKLMKKTTSTKKVKSPTRHNLTGHELSFSVHDFSQYERDHLWYIGIGLLAISGLIWAVWGRDWLLSMVVILVAVAVFRLANEPPHSRQVKISSRGVFWGDQLLPYHKLKSFWLAEMGGRVHLYLEQLNFSGDLRIIVPQNRIEETFVFLSQLLPWRPRRRVPLGDRLGHWLKF